MGVNVMLGVLAILSSTQMHYQATYDAPLGSSSTTPRTSATTSDHQEQNLRKM